MAANEARPRPVITGGFGRLAPPNDPLKAVFTEEVRDRWRRTLNEELLHRLKVLCAFGSHPSDPARDRELRFLRAQKAAWETYTFTAYACGMFEGERGNDIRKRLTSRKPDCFRSAMAECEVCWFLAGRMRLPVDPTSPGRSGKNLDMQVVLAGQEVGVEVKAPFRATPAQHFWYGDDSDKIAQAMKSANEQFDDERPNLLCLVPSLRCPMFSRRYDLLKAAYGQSMITS